LLRESAHRRNHSILRHVDRLFAADPHGFFKMIEFLTYLLCVAVTLCYLREPRELRRRRPEPNLNPAVDEWNAQQMVEEESESFYE